MTKYRVIIQPSAATEMERAFRWIAKRNLQGAVNWYNGLEEAMQSLSTLPERLPRAPESDAFKEEIRQLIYGRRIGRYRICFTIRADAVHVLSS